MVANKKLLYQVFEKIKPAWYPQLDDMENEIELTDVNQRNVSMETPLMIAAQFLEPEDIQILIENGADINALSGSEQNNSALHIARLMGKFDNASKLIELGANVDLLNGIGKTPMQYGQRNSQT